MKETVWRTDSTQAERDTYPFPPLQPIIYQITRFQSYTREEYI